MVDISKMKREMYDVVGAIHEVHNELGAGLNEYCYQEGLKMELEEEGISFEKEVSFTPTYHGCPMSSSYRLDFLCKDIVIVECKAVTELTNTHRAQLFNYMRLTKKPCGILVNFSPKFATIERYLYDEEGNVILTMDGHVMQML